MGRCGFLSISDIGQVLYGRNNFVRFVCLEKRWREGRDAPTAVKGAVLETGIRSDTALVNVSQCWRFG